MLWFYDYATSARATKKAEIHPSPLPGSLTFRSLWSILSPSGRSAVRQRAWFGTKRSAVQIRAPRLCGSSAVVAHLPSKQTVAGSNPVSRFTLGNGPGHRHLAGAVLHRATKGVQEL
jgi:hypothetical protein